MRGVLSLISVLLILTACVKGEEKGLSSESHDSSATKDKTYSPAESAVDYYIDLIPSEPRGNSHLELLIKNVEPEKLKIEWFVNGRPQSTGMLRFSTEGLTRGDVIAVKVSMDDNLLFLKELRIKNTPPQLKRVKLMPEVFNPGDTLYVDAEAIDPDGDPVIVLYEWSRNEEPAGNQRAIQGTVKRGDRITVRIIPFDGEDYGEAVVLRRQIANMPPIIIDYKDHHLDGTLFTCHIKAMDPDGDTLIYSLKTSPEGMTIEPETGLIKWNVPSDFKGKVPVTLSVSDGHGGEAIQSFELTIGFERR